jgi:hypothetical protein
MQSTTDALGALFAGLDALGQRRTTGTAADVDADLAEVVASVDTIAGATMRPMNTSSVMPPPRAVGVAMAHALFTAPHLVATMSAQTTISDAHSFMPSDALADALALPRWEIDDLREEVDYRVSTLLKRMRALQWLWTRQDHPRLNPGPLVATLFPGAPPDTPVHFSRSRLRLYAAIDAPNPPDTSSLYLTWRSDARTWPADPDLRFDARYVDTSVLRSLGRALGTTADEARDMLAEIVCVIPKSARDAFITHDRWRADGWADLTGIGAGDASWLTRTLAADALDDEGWLEGTSEGVAVRSARRVFDRHALARMTTIYQQSLAELCARTLARSDASEADVAATFDLSPRSSEACSRCSTGPRRREPTRTSRRRSARHRRTSRQRSSRSVGAGWTPHSVLGAGRRRRVGPTACRPCSPPTWRCSGPRCGGRPR